MFGYRLIQSLFNFPKIYYYIRGMENLLDRITIDTNQLNGKPAIRGKRISVQTILEFLSAGESEAEILKQYPSLESKDIKACLRFATLLMDNHYTIKTVA